MKERLENSSSEETKLNPSSEGTVEYPLPAPSLREIIRKDKELYDFFKLVDERGFRQKALELFEGRQARQKTQ